MELMPFDNQRQLFYWDRGRPARNAPQARSLLPVGLKSFSRFARLRAGPLLKARSQ
jgi:hypothetical protein